MLSEIIVFYFSFTAELENRQRLTMPPATAAPQYAPPDGGWGWVVVFGAFISIGFSYAFPKAITVFFKEIQEIFHTSYSEIAWISSIMLAVMYAGGKAFEKLTNNIAI